MSQPTDPLACEGCGMHDPCGVHFDDCTLLENGDFVVHAIWRGLTFNREEVCQPVSDFEVRLRFPDGRATTKHVLARDAEEAEDKAVRNEEPGTVPHAYEAQP